MEAWLVKFHRELKALSRPFMCYLELRICGSGQLELKSWRRSESPKGNLCFAATIKISWEIFPQGQRVEAAVQVTEAASLADS